MDIKEIARKNVGSKDGNSPSEIIFNPLCAPYYVLTTLRRKFPCNVVVKGESLADTPSFLLEVAIVFQNHSYFPFSWTFKIVRKLPTFIYHCMAGYTRLLFFAYLLQSKLAISNSLIRNILVLRNHFLWPICHLLHKNKELLALRNNLEASKKFLIAKFDCTRLVISLVPCL